MKLKYWKPKREGVVKCSIHRSGKLGFSIAAVKSLELTQNKFFKFAVDEDVKNLEIIYMKLQDVEDEHTLRPSKAGSYFFLNTRDFFNTYGLDYKKSTIIYDICEVEIEGEKWYKLVKREKPRK